MPRADQQHSNIHIKTHALIKRSSVYVTKVNNVISFSRQVACCRAPFRQVRSVATPRSHWPGRAWGVGRLAGGGGSCRPQEHNDIACDFDHAAPRSVAVPSKWSPLVWGDYHRVVSGPFVCRGKLNRRRSVVGLFI